MGVAQTFDITKNFSLTSTAGATPTPALPTSGWEKSGLIHMTVGIISSFWVLAFSAQPARQRAWPFRTTAAVQPGNGKSVQMSYWRAPEICMDDQTELLQWCEKAMQAAVRAAQKKPKPKPKPKK